MRCDMCPLSNPEDVCPEAEGQYGIKHEDGTLGCRHPRNWVEKRDAMEKFNATAQDIPLPRNAEYVDTSFRLVTEDPDEMLAHVTPVND